MEEKKRKENSCAGRVSKEEEEGEEQKGRSEGRKWGGKSCVLSYTASPQKICASPDPQRQ